jgi:hypothetical protein
MRLLDGRKYRPLFSRGKRSFGSILHPSVPLRSAFALEPAGIADFVCLRQRRHRSYTRFFFSSQFTLAVADLDFPNSRILPNHFSGDPPVPVKGTISRPDSSGCEEWGLPLCSLRLIPLKQTN